VGNFGAGVATTVANITEKLEVLPTKSTKLWRIDPPIFI